MVQRFLSAIVLVLTLVTGVYFGYHVHSIEAPVPEVVEPFEVEVEEVTQASFSFSDLLSRLTLLPFRGREKSFVAVVVENHEYARPHQRGFDRAALIQEFLVEGLISRFVVFFDVNQLPESVGPIRSLRSYFIDAVSPITNTIYHAGGSPDALERVDNGDIHGFNGLNLPDHFIRGEGAPAPHDLFVSKNAILDLQEHELPKLKWPPYATGRLNRTEDFESAKTIRLHFYNPLHDVLYDYHPRSRRYIRTNGGVVSEAEPRNVLVIESSILSIGEYGRLNINMHRNGRGYLFRNGNIQEILWSKEDINSPFMFTNLEGEPLLFASGLTWMTTVESLDRVEWVD